MESEFSSAELALIISAGVVAISLAVYRWRGSANTTENTQFECPVTNDVPAAGTTHSVISANHPRTSKTNSQNSVCECFSDGSKKILKIPSFLQKKKSDDKQKQP
ncbi:hypothetical protein O0L34_g15203 [Tuta absoluta]|nr:hypothetical protein O0L34_g15203 [Tuta absoluta]